MAYLKKIEGKIIMAMIQQIPADMLTRVPFLKGRRVGIRNLLLFLMMGSIALVSMIHAEEAFFQLKYPGITNVIDYEKYGTFEKRGTADFQYVIRDKTALAELGNAVGEGIYPAMDLVKNDPVYRLFEKRGEMKGSYWDFLQDDNYQRAFFKWATAEDDPGVQMFYIGNILKSAGLYKHALKAYYALLIHFPLTVMWNAAGDSYWFAAPIALANIRQICKHHPELGMNLEGATVSILPKTRGKITMTAFNKKEYNIRIDPGFWVKSPETVLVPDKTIIGWVPNENAKVCYARLKDGAFQLYVDGKPFYIKGVGYGGEAKTIAENGGNAFRTWGHDNPDDALMVLDEAQKYGLKVCLGLWIDQERQGFDYDFEEGVVSRAEDFKAVIDAVKDHPALLMYGIGNELNYLSSNPKVWDQVNAIAKYAHSVDSNHPTATIIAGFDDDVKQLIMTRAPEIDIIGVNSYGGIESTIEMVEDADTGRPYMITEWGVNGYWEVALTPWRAPIEPSSGDKTKLFLKRYKLISEHQKCLGSFSFLWGFKQERTHTWFNVFLEGGHPTEIVDVMRKNWTGEYPKYQSPSVKSIEIKGVEDPKKVYLVPGQNCVSTLNCSVSDILYTFSWELYRESTAMSFGGDKEEKPEMVQFHYTGNGNTIHFKAPIKKGAYRLFGYVIDSGDRVGYANIPFYVDKK